MKTQEQKQVVFFEKQFTKLLQDKTISAETIIKIFQLALEFNINIYKAYLFVKLIRPELAPHLLKELDKNDFFIDKFYKKLFFSKKISSRYLINFFSFLPLLVEDERAVKEAYKVIDLPLSGNSPMDC